MFIGIKNDTYLFMLGVMAWDKNVKNEMWLLKEWKPVKFLLIFYFINKLEQENSKNKYYILISYNSS